MNDREEKYRRCDGKTKTRGNGERQKEEWKERAKEGTKVCRPFWHVFPFLCSEGGIVVRAPTSRRA